MIWISLLYSAGIIIVERVCLFITYCIFGSECLSKLLWRECVQIKCFGGFQRLKIIGDGWEGWCSGQRTQVM